MKRRRLGRTGLVVSEVCMGTMTFGLQCDEATSIAILDHAYSSGIDFYDTAEIYPVPPKAELVGRTEEILGKWMRTKPRDSVLIATKVTGPGHGWFTPPVRHGKTALDSKQIKLAVENSLRRLQTDYIDLYQTHWPDHGMPYEDILGTLTELIRQGKIRAAGCSNETSWGLMKSLWQSDRHSLARYETVQNNFSLINRRCESELAQVCRREQVSLLPYSPLGGGVLSGKYNDSVPNGARFADYLINGGERQKRMAARFVNPRTIEVTRRVAAIAQDIGTSSVALALAWSKQHDFVASTIVGASSLAQLKESLASVELTLDAQTLSRIDAIEDEIPNPMKEDGLRRL
jgi:aryl-alcohol dehydrogenase-like predicted oxidoreductase